MPLLIELLPFLQLNITGIHPINVGFACWEIHLFTFRNRVWKCVWAACSLSVAKWSVLTCWPCSWRHMTLNSRDCCWHALSREAYRWMKKKVKGTAYPERIHATWLFPHFVILCCITAFFQNGLKYFFLIILKHPIMTTWLFCFFFPQMY